MYVIKCGQNGKYTGMFVAKSGHHSSYTRDILYVQTFTTYEEAVAMCCGNEYPVKI